MLKQFKVSQCTDTNLIHPIKWKWMKKKIKVITPNIYSTFHVWIWMMHGIFACNMLLLFWNWLYYAHTHGIFVLTHRIAQGMHLSRGDIGNYPCLMQVIIIYIGEVRSDSRNRRLTLNTIIFEAHAQGIILSVSIFRIRICTACWSSDEF